MENKHEAATVTSEWMGVPVEVIEKAHIRFFTDVTPDWLANAEMYAEILNRLGNLRANSRVRSWLIRWIRSSISVS